MRSYVMSGPTDLNVLVSISSTFLAVCSRKWSPEEGGGRTS